MSYFDEDYKATNTVYILWHKFNPYGEPSFMGIYATESRAEEEMYSYGAGGYSREEFYVQEYEVKE